MELVMLGSNAFAHIVEALILWMGMSQMYEARYKQVVTGLVIMVGACNNVLGISDRKYLRCYDS